MVSIITGLIILWIFSAQEYGFVRVLQNSVSTILIFSHLGLTAALSHLVAQSLDNSESHNALTYLIAAVSAMMAVFGLPPF